MNQNTLTTHKWSGEHSLWHNSSTLQALGFIRQWVNSQFSSSTFWMQEKWVEWSAEGLWQGPDLYGQMTGSAAWGCSQSAVVVPMDNVPRRDKSQTSDRVLDTQCARATKVILSGPRWQKVYNRQNISLKVTGGVCHSTQCTTPCFVWGCIDTNRSKCPC